MTTSSEETASVKRYEAGISVYHEEYKICTREQAQVVLASDYDALAIERDRLRQRVAELEAVVRQYASECAECDGTGHGPTIHSVQGGEIVETTLACKECAFIRLALSGEK